MDSYGHSETVGILLSLKSDRKGRSLSVDTQRGNLEPSRT